MARAATTAPATPMPCPTLCAAPAVLTGFAEDAGDVADAAAGEADMVDPEAAIVVANIEPELDIVFDRTPVMLDMALDSTPVILEDMLVVLTPATAAVVEAIIVLLATEDVLEAEELAHDTVEGRVTPATAHN